MTKKILALLGAASASVIAHAEYSVTLDTTLASQYYFRGEKLAEGYHLMPSVDVAVGDFNVGAWVAQSLTGASDYSEVDFYAGYSFAVSENLSIPVGFTYYYYPKADVGAGADRGTYEANIGLSTSFAGIDVNPVAYYDFTLKQLTLELNTGYSIPLEDMGTSLDFYATLGYFDRDGNYEHWYYTVGVDLPYALNDNVSVKTGVALVDSFSRTSGAAKPGPSQFVWTAGISASF